MRRDFEVICEALESCKEKIDEVCCNPKVTGDLYKKLNTISGNFALTINQLYRMCEDLPEEDELETEAAVKQYMKDKLTEEDLSYLKFKFGMEAHEIYAI